MDEIATKDSWENTPIQNPKRIEINLLFTEEQFLKLKLGLLPHEMEDKWFIYYEDGWLYFHRSWTGYCLYKARLIKDGSHYLMHEFWAERNPTKYSNEDDEEDKQIIVFLIAKGLLNVDCNFEFSAAEEAGEMAVMKKWKLFGRLLFDRPGDDDPDAD